MARDLTALLATQGLTREHVTAGIREGAIAAARRELALVLAALESDRCLPAYALASLRRVELMLRADTIQELGDRLLARARAEAARCL